MSAGQALDYADAKKPVSTLVSRRGSCRMVVVWLLLLVGVVASLVIAIGGLPGRDSSVFVYVADGLLDGEAPYADRWDHKGPLVYMIDSLGRVVTPGSFTGIRAMEVVVFAAWAGLAFLVARPAFGGVAAVFGVVIATVTCVALVDGGNMTEEWALLPQFAALYLFTRDQRTGSGALDLRTSLLAIGALGASAFLLRPNLVAIWFVIGVYWLVWDDARWRKLSWSIVGGLGALATAGLVIAAAGLWEPFTDAVLAFNATYTDVGGPKPQAWRFVQTWAQSPLVIPATLLWTGIVLTVWRDGGRPAAATTLLRFVALLWPLELLMISIGGRGYVHYLLATLPALLILMSFGGRLVLRGSSALTARRKPVNTRKPPHLAGMVSPDALVFALAALWFGMMAVAPSIGLYDRPGLVAREAAASDGSRRLAARLVSERTTPDEHVLVWGSEAMVYLLAERTAPSRFFYQVPLVTSGYADDELAAEFASEVERAAPKMIIDARHGCLPPLDPTSRSNWQPRCSSPTTIPDTLHSFFRFVEREYRAGPDVGNWATYELRDA